MWWENVGDSSTEDIGSFDTGSKKLVTRDLILATAVDSNLPVTKNFQEEYKIIWNWA